MTNEDDNYYDAKACPDKKTVDKSYDREDYSYDVKDSIASSAKSMSTGDYSFDELDFDKFSAFMSKKYSKDKFKKGFEIIQKFKSERFEKKSIIESSIKDVLGSAKEAEEFVGLCSSYMILENYASSMGSS